MLADALVDAEAEALVLAEAEALVLVEALAEVLREMLVEALDEMLTDLLVEELIEIDSETEILSLTERDKLLEFSELLVDVVPKTTVSFVTNKSGFSKVFSTATVSLAKTFV